MALPPDFDFSLTRSRQTVDSGASSEEDDKTKKGFWKAMGSKMRKSFSYLGNKVKKTARFTQKEKGKWRMSDEDVDVEAPSHSQGSGTPDPNVSTESNDTAAGSGSAGTSGSSQPTLPRYEARIVSARSSDDNLGNVRMTFDFWESQFNPYAFASPQPPSPSSSPSFYRPTPEIPEDLRPRANFARPTAVPDDRSDSSSNYETSRFSPCSSFGSPSADSTDVRLVTPLSAPPVASSASAQPAANAPSTRRDGIRGVRDVFLDNNLTHLGDGERLSGSLWFAAGGTGQPPTGLSLRQGRRMATRMVGQVELQVQEQWIPPSPPITGLGITLLSDSRVTRPNTNRANPALDNAAPGHSNDFWVSPARIHPSESVQAPSRSVDFFDEKYYAPTANHRTRRSNIRHKRPRVPSQQPLVVVAAGSSPPPPPNNQNALRYTGHYVLPFFTLTTDEVTTILRRRARPPREDEADEDSNDDEDNDENDEDNQDWRRFPQYPSRFPTPSFIPPPTLQRTHAHRIVAGIQESTEANLRNIPTFQEASALPRRDRGNANWQQSGHPEIAELPAERSPIETRSEVSSGELRRARAELTATNRYPRHGPPVRTSPRTLPRSGVSLEAPGTIETRTPLALLPHGPDPNPEMVAYRRPPHFRARRARQSQSMQTLFERIVSSYAGATDAGASRGHPASDLPPARPNTPVTANYQLPLFRHLSEIISRTQMARERLASEDRAVPTLARAARRRHPLPFPENRWGSNTPNGQSSLSRGFAADGSSTGMSSHHRLINGRPVATVPPLNRSSTNAITGNNASTDPSISNSNSNSTSGSIANTRSNNANESSTTPSRTSGLRPTRSRIPIPDERRWARVVEWQTPFSPGRARNENANPALSRSNFTQEQDDASITSLEDEIEEEQQQSQNQGQEQEQEQDQDQD